MPTIRPFRATRTLPTLQAFISFAASTTEVPASTVTRSCFISCPTVTIVLFLLFVLFVLDQPYNSLVSARLAVRYRLVKLGGIAGSQDAGQRFNLAFVRMSGPVRAGQKSTCPAESSPFSNRY